MSLMIQTLAASGQATRSHGGRGASGHCRASSRSASRRPGDAKRIAGPVTGDAGAAPAARRSAAAERALRVSPPLWQGPPLLPNEAQRRPRARPSAPGWQPAREASSQGWPNHQGARIAMSRKQRRQIARNRAKSRPGGENSRIAVVAQQSSPPRGPGAARIATRKPAAARHCRASGGGPRPG